MAQKNEAQARYRSIRIDEATYRTLLKKKYETGKTILVIVREAVS